MSILDSGRIPAAKFPTIGTSVSGPITKEPQELKQTDFKTGEPLTWNDGSPRMQWVITVQTDRRDDEDDDGRRRVFAKGQLLNEIRRAVKKAPAKDLEVGGVLTITYARDGERTDATLTPPKVYEVTYIPPTDSDDDEDAIGAAISNTTTHRPSDPLVPRPGRLSPPGLRHTTPLRERVMNTELDMLVHAVGYARHHWEVFPLNGKVPAIAGGRGVLDATCDIDTITAWWGRYPYANIGGRVPDPMVVIDVDPRHRGLDTVTELQRRHGPLPETLTTISGRGDGGCHYFYRRPPGKLSAKRLGAGIDLKTSTGYVVLAPSIHPNTGNPYRRIDRPVAAPPAWLIELLRPERVEPKAAPRKSLLMLSGPSIADKFTESTSWADILELHGWHCLDADPDADGARWLHPAATSACSATVRHGCLFVYSPNTPFDISKPSDPHGYTRFRAYAVLEHNGDLSAAART